MPKKLLLTFLVLVQLSLFKAQHDSTRIVIPHVSPALRFTENKGQWKDQILFRAHLDGGSLFLEKDGLLFDFYDKKKYRSLHHGGYIRGLYKDMNLACHAYKLFFDGANPNPVVMKQQKGKDYENFYLGNDQSKWQHHVNNYHQVWLKDLYRGIDYEVITAANGIKYNFHVAPSASPADIKMRYEGVNKMRLRDGALYVDLQINGVKEQRPFAYQMIQGKVVKVPCVYKLNGNVLSFDFPKGYDTRYELVIDPVLVFAAQSGSTADNFGMTATYDAAGNLYAGGTAYNNGYPVTLGAYSTTFAGPGGGSGTDVVITKYNASGNALLYSTYIGGTNSEIVSSLIVDGNDNLCFYGATGSNNFPTTAGAFDNTFNGGVSLSFQMNGTFFTNGTDIFVAKFNSSGSNLLASTYLGGSDNDGVNHVNHTTPLTFGTVTVNEYYIDSLQFNYGDQYRGEIQVDVVNNIYITSSTRSNNFPTASPFDNTLGGKQDAIVTKFNPNLSQLMFSTYLGGNKNDCGNSLIVTLGLEVYVTGGTCSGDFPVTTGAHSTAYNGGKTDGYICHLNTAGNTLLQSTFVGTNNYDQSYFIQADKYGNIYVYGQSLGNMPIVNSGTIVPYNNPGRHQFITRYTPTLSNKTMSTVFGNYTNNVDISPSAFAVDKCNNIYLSGWGGNIITGGPVLAAMPLFQPTQVATDGFDFYFFGLDSNFVIKYGSYFGGGQSQEHVDGGTSRFDPRGRIYQSACAGCGGHDDFPVTPGAWPLTPGNPNHNTDNNNCNNGVVKLDFQLQMAIATINTATLGGCAPFTATFISATPPTNPGATFFWDLGNGITTSTNINPVVTYTAPGIYTVSLEINDNLTCNKKDKTITYVTVYPSPSANISVQSNPCSNTVSLSQSSTGNFGPNPYTWNMGDGSPTKTATTLSHTYTANGIYTISFTATDINGCKGVKTTTVSIFDFAPQVAAGYSVCSGFSTNINASGGTSYNWSPSTGLSSSSSASPSASPNVTTVYTVQISNNSPGYTCTKTMTTEVLVRPTPTTGFTYSLNPCGGGAYFIDKSNSDITSWLWKLAPNKTSTVQNPYYFYSTGGVYTITLLAGNVYGCKNEYQQVLTIGEPPPVAVTTKTQICRTGTVQLGASGGVSYQWTPTLSLDFPNMANPVANPQVSTEYSVMINTSVSVGGNPCNFLLTTEVDVDVLSNGPISANANPVLVITGNASTLTYVGDPGALITWTPATQPATGYTVQAFPVKPTTYTVIASKGACTEEVTVHVDSYTEGCIDKDTFIPNTFTPNGDGQNDVLYVRGLKVDEVYFAIYNRWGELVFETNDKTKGWDGIYKNKPADVGVFGWYLRVKCFNGAESFKKGNVTLIR